MSDVSIDPKSRVAEFTVDDGCPLCEGKILVRFTPGVGARGYCASCHVLSKPELSVVGGQRVQLAQKIVAEA